MFKLRDLRLLVAFFATSALAAGPPTSEQSEAQITGECHLAFALTAVSPFSPASDVTDPNVECQPYY
jgi:hypothetical protein